MLKQMGKWNHELAQPEYPILTDYRAALGQANETRTETKARRRDHLADLLQNNPDLTNPELADLLEVSVSTAKKDKKSLNGHTNGQRGGQ